MRDDSERLTDLLEAIGRIEKYTNDGRATLDQELVQIWVLHHLMIIGEACRGLSPQFRMDHPQDVWT